jgi:putative DNA-invertase from lambdoid prophage Rac
MCKHTAIYIRVSTAEQNPDSQIQELSAYCAMRGWTKTIQYIEKESGAKVSRPVLQRMMVDLRSGKIGQVICFKLDRLGRSLTHLALLLDEMSRLGVPLVCTTQGIDTSSDSATGKLQLGVLMAVAEFERSLIRERVNSGLRAAKARGVKLGRPQTLNSRMAEVLNLHRSGKGIRGIARELKMPPSSVSKILRAAKTSG